MCILLQQIHPYPDHNPQSSTEAVLYRMRIISYVAPLLNRHSRSEARWMTCRWCSWRLHRHRDSDHCGPRPTWATGTRTCIAAWALARPRTWLSTNPRPRSHRVAFPSSRLRENYVLPAECWVCNRGGRDYSALSRVQLTLPLSLIRLATYQIHPFIAIVYRSRVVIFSHIEFTITLCVLHEMRRYVRYMKSSIEVIVDGARDRGTDFHLEVDGSNPISA